MVRIPCFRCHGPGMIPDHRAVRSRKPWAWPKKEREKQLKYQLFWESYLPSPSTKRSCCCCVRSTLSLFVQVLVYFYLESRDFVSLTCVFSATFTSRFSVYKGPSIWHLCARLVVQSCSTLATLWSVARQAPLSMVVLQPRILEWLAMLSSRGSSQPRNQTHASCIASCHFTGFLS